jgi:hypothetical protein
MSLTCNDSVIATGAGLSGQLSVDFPHLAKPTCLRFNGIGEYQTAAFNWLDKKIVYESNSVVDGLRFQVLSGTYASGTVTMYGLKNS